MKLSKKLLALLLACVMVCGLLVGCGSSSSTDSDRKDASEIAEERIMP